MFHPERVNIEAPLVRLFVAPNRYTRPLLATLRSMDQSPISRLPIGPSVYSVQVIPPSVLS